MPSARRTKTRPSPRTSALPEPLRSRVVEVDGCWLWTGRVHTVTGYGVYAHTTAHRHVWTALVGAIPAGMHLDHHGPDGCGVKLCVNPAHLECVTPYANVVARSAHPNMISHREGVCRRGHPLGRADRDGRRRCRTCKIDGQRRRRNGHPLGKEQ